jgi:hypothetical protein
LLAPRPHDGVARLHRHRDGMLFGPFACNICTRIDSKDGLLGRFELLGTPVSVFAEHDVEILGSGGSHTAEGGWRKPRGNAS